MEIPLSRGKVAVIDDGDYSLIKDYHWFAVNPGKTFYATGHRSMIDGVRKKVSMHRLIMGAQSNEVVDHINGNGLDNRRSNLRLCTRSENQWNRHRTCGTSKYKGVCWASMMKKWKAAIRYYGKRINLGFFDTEDEAAKAYDEKAKELFGKFVQLNIKEEV